LGYADVNVYASAKAAKNANTGEEITLKDGRTLPIKFRIEHGAAPTPWCGDGIVDPSLQKECDGADLSDATCESLGFMGGGTLTCSSFCYFDTNSCVP
jgi:hypothetical protein